MCILTVRAFILLTPEETEISLKILKKPICPVCFNMSSPLATRLMSMSAHF